MHACILNPDINIHTYIYSIFTIYANYWRNSNNYKKNKKEHFNNSKVVIKPRESRKRKKIDRSGGGDGWSIKNHIPWNEGWKYGERCKRRYWRGSIRITWLRSPYINHAFKLRRANTFIMYIFTSFSINLCNNNLSVHECVPLLSSSQQVLKNPSAALLLSLSLKRCFYRQNQPNPTHLMHFFWWFDLLASFWQPPYIICCLKGSKSRGSSKPPVEKLKQFLCLCT